MHGPDSAPVFSVRGLPGREGINTNGLQRGSEMRQLGTLPAAVDSLEGNQYPGLHNTLVILGSRGVIGREPKVRISDENPTTSPPAEPGLIVAHKLLYPV